ncbi:MAG: LamG-like jellyroll fold domain-containing protein [candidate division WOR-3 bacterium]
MVLDFTAEIDSHYSFDVEYLGGAKLILDKIALKDHAGGYATETVSFKIEGGGRRFEVRDGEHVLDGYVFHFLPGSVPAGTVIRTGLGRPIIPPGGGSLAMEPVKISAASSGNVSLQGNLRLHIPLDRRDLHQAGIRDRDLVAVLQTSGGGIITYGLPLGGNIQVTPSDLPQGIGDLGLNGNGFDIGVYIPHNPGGWFIPEGGQVPPPPEGFTKDFESYNLFHFALNDPAGFSTVADTSGHHKDGTVSGSVSLFSPGYYGAAAKFEGGYITVNVGTKPKAFAFEAWLRFENIPAGNENYTIVFQPGNFNLVAVRNYSGGQVNVPIIELKLFVYDSASGTNRLVASTYYDPALWIQQTGTWHHVVALFDGHHKGRIYVDGRVNSNFIASFENGLNQPIVDPSDRPMWPREITSEPQPVILGAYTDGMILTSRFQGKMDEVRYSDITRFRVNDAPGCPPRCRPGENARADFQEGDPYYDPFRRLDHYSWGNWLHAAPWLDYRLPYVQDVTDHSAVITWRRKSSLYWAWVCRDGTEENCYYWERIDILTTMQICWEEIKPGEHDQLQPFDNCTGASPQQINPSRTNYPDLLYLFKIDNLRPSTWYRYKIRQLVEEQTYFPGTQIPVIYELATNAFFRTAPLAMEDQVEIFAFGDFSARTGCCCFDPCESDCAEEPYRTLGCGYDTFEIDMNGAVSAKAHMLTLDERPSLWLAPGDLAQTGYNGPFFEAYLFAVFNRQNLYDPNLYPPHPDLFNAMMKGVPIYGSLGNHNWYPKGKGSLFCINPSDLNSCFWSGGNGSASEQMNNLYPPPRRFEEAKNRKFAYGSSSYSFDYGNMHIVVLGAAYDDHCEHRYMYMSNADPNQDKDCYLAPWNNLVANDAWREKISPGGISFSDFYDSNQFIWLKRDLWQYKNDKNIWKIVVFHVPLYGDGDEPVVPGWSHINNHMSLDIRARLARLFEYADVDLILTGHDHWFHLMNTGPISERLFGSIPDDQHAVHAVVGTGGYGDEEGLTCSPYISDQIGVSRVFIDGNMMYLVWDDQRCPESGWGCLLQPLEKHCLFVKGVTGLIKSECYQASDFPMSPCLQRNEGNLCHYTLPDQRSRIYGRCLIPHSGNYDIISWWHWGDRLRCIPLPDSAQPNDRDYDDIPDHLDNCPDDWNFDQGDTDNDGMGDSCDWPMP